MESMLNRCPTSSFVFYSINLNLFHLKDIILTRWWVKLKKQWHNMNKTDQGCRFL
ncbi:hypothetical protein HanXRQr2_Chr07g0297141 [Helianthus annuus]|uniref:Uncharacterized protein n=2 Tax=Helianthus annuus TaxID=4232 RepID=A0A9K3NFV8_HELAN|nr:hypothetical protein HanXRQr2_Chr09g0389221 [Helianthus annuus]KAF5798799.1 hypothetical protein HanXRQr2_Chr07g0297141 [Helianthus annuus]KAJ0893214.1 hypothetical protein HanPSC8_Chr09g0375101 [Helianthus annuus]KAJ0904901.1 hypothetical protein HanPSC8_Chr07g0287671 [Helianthus annuus]